MFDMANRRAKWSEIWDSGNIYVITLYVQGHFAVIWCTCTYKNFSDNTILTSPLFLHLWFFFNQTFIGVLCDSAYKSDFFWGGGEFRHLKFVKKKKKF